MISFIKKDPLVAVLLATTLLLACVISVPKTGDSLFVPFGGQITTIFPGCVAPAGSAITITGAVPRPLMYVAGSYSYSHGPPTRPGQYLLGQSTLPVPCLIRVWVPGGLFTAGYYILVPYPGQPMGFTIWYHGSSL